MKPDGDFGAVFYKDSARSIKVRHRVGYWTTRENLVLFNAVGAKKYNIYFFKVIDADTVQYTTITPGDASDCRLHVYTERRVRD